MNAHEIENYIDKHGLENTVAKLGELLAGACFEKSEHANTNWQDRALASDWHRKGQKIEKALVILSLKLNQ